MDLKITNEKMVPLLDRKEVTAEVTFDKVTPSREELKKAVAHKTAAKEELVVVRKIETAFGKTKATVTACIYNDAAAMSKIETRTMIKRQSKPEKKKE
jgi:small subunit ribosomal protein S24e